MSSARKGTRTHHSLAFVQLLPVGLVSLAVGVMTVGVASPHRVDIA